MGGQAFSDLLSHKRHEALIRRSGVLDLLTADPRLDRLAATGKTNASAASTARRTSDIHSAERADGGIPFLTRRRRWVRRGGTLSLELCVDLPEALRPV